MTTTERNRAIKKFLLNNLGNKSLRVVGGKGTAYGWITISIDVPKPVDCFCHNLRFEHCVKCKQLMCDTTNDINVLVYQDFRNELDTYYSDDDSVARTSMLVDVNVVK